VSVLIQRTELSETRDALQKNQPAAEKQAKLSLLSTKIENINIRLSLLAGELDHCRSARPYYVQAANTGHGHIPKVITETGKFVDPLEMIKAEGDRIAQIEKLQLELTEKLTLILHEVEANT